MGFTELLKDISLIVASCTAIYGIGSWRRQYRGKKREELAEEALSLFYEAGDAIKHIRHPFSDAGEGSSRKQSENETEAEKKAYDRAYVAFERYNNNIELFSKLHSIRYRFMTQFGVEAAKPFVDLRKLLNKILVTAQTLAGIWARQRSHFRTEQQEKEHYDFRDKLEAILWDQLADDDPINQLLDNCVSDLEKTCRDIISDKGIIHYLSNHPVVTKLKSQIANKTINS